MSFKRDKAIADQFNAGEVGYTPDLMCRAQGCPNRWSVDAEGRNKLCSAHAWSDPHLWPRITQEQLDAVSTHAMRQKPEPKTLNYAERVAALKRLQQIGLLTNRDPKQWAHDLHEREADGEVLTSARRAMWRSVVNEEKSDGNV